MEEVGYQMTVVVAVAVVVVVVSFVVIEPTD